MIHEYPYTDLHEVNLDWFIAKIKELETRMNTVEGGFEEVRQLVDDLDATVQALEQLVNQLGDRVDDIEGDIEDLQEALDTLGQSLQALASRVSSLETVTEGLVDDVEQLQTDVSGLQSSVGQLQTTVSGLTSRVGTLESGQTVQDGRLTALESGIATKFSWNDNLAVGATNIFAWDLDNTTASTTLNGVTFDIAYTGTLFIGGTASGNTTFNNKILCHDLYETSKEGIIFRSGNAIPSGITITLTSQSGSGQSYTLDSNTQEVTIRNYQGVTAMAISISVEGGNTYNFNTMLEMYLSNTPVAIQNGYNESTVNNRELTLELYKNRMNIDALIGDISDLQAAVEALQNQAQGKLGIVKVWENANLTQAFAAQNVEITDAEQYSGYFVEYSNGGSTTTSLTKYIPNANATGTGGQLWYVLNANTPEYVIDRYVAPFYVNNAAAGLRFGNGQSAGATNNAVCRPLKIYGVVEMPDDGYTETVLWSNPNRSVAFADNQQINISENLNDFDMIAVDWCASTSSTDIRRNYSKYGFMCALIAENLFDYTRFVDLDSNNTISIRKYNNTVDNNHMIPVNIIGIKFNNTVNVTDLTNIENEIDALDTRVTALEGSGQTVKKAIVWSNGSTGSFAGGTITTTAVTDLTSINQLLTVTMYYSEDGSGYYARESDKYDFSNGFGNGYVRMQAFSDGTLCQRDANFLTWQNGVMTVRFSDGQKFTSYNSNSLTGDNSKCIPRTIEVIYTVDV